MGKYGEPGKTSNQVTVNTLNEWAMKFKDDILIIGFLKRLTDKIFLSVKIKSYFSTYQ